MNTKWTNAYPVDPSGYTCGHCGTRVGSALGYSAGKTRVIRICPKCDQPTFFEGDRQLPGVAHGRSVEHCPEVIGHAYNEARNCMTANAYTAAAMLSRKIIMCVAVTLGKTHRPHLPFQECVQYLVDEKHVPIRCADWVDHVRKIGNEANHELDPVSRQDAENVLSFVEMLLVANFEYPGKAMTA